MDKETIIKELIDLKNISQSDDKVKNQEISDKVSKLISGIISLNSEVIDDEPKKFPDTSYFKSNKNLTLDI